MSLGLMTKAAEATGNLRALGIRHPPDTPPKKKPKRRSPPKRGSRQSSRIQGLGPESTTCTSTRITFLDDVKKGTFNLLVIDVFNNLGTNFGRLKEILVRDPMHLDSNLAKPQLSKEEGDTIKFVPYSTCHFLTVTETKEGKDVVSQKQAFTLPSQETPKLIPHLFSKRGDHVEIEYEMLHVRYQRHDGVVGGEWTNPIPHYILLNTSTKAEILVTAEELKEGYLYLDHVACTRGLGMPEEAINSRDVYVKSNLLGWHRVPIVLALLVNDLELLIKEEDKEYVERMEVELRKAVQQLVSANYKEFFNFDMVAKEIKADGYDENRLNSNGQGGEYTVGAYRDLKGLKKGAPNFRTACGVKPGTEKYFQLYRLITVLTVLNLRKIKKTFCHGSVHMVNTTSTGRLHIDTFRSFSSQMCMRFCSSPEMHANMAFMQVEGVLFCSDLLKRHCDKGCDEGIVYVAVDVHVDPRLEVTATNTLGYEEIEQQSFVELNAYDLQNNEKCKMMIKFQDLYSSGFYKVGSLKTSEGEAAALISDPVRGSKLLGCVYGVNCKEQSTKMIPIVEDCALIKEQLESYRTTQVKEVALKRKFYHIDSSISEKETRTIGGKLVEIYPDAALLPQQYPHTNVRLSQRKEAEGEAGGDPPFCLRFFSVPESLQHSPSTTDPEVTRKLINDCKDVATSMAAPPQ